MAGAPLPTPGKWLVFRHGGRRTDSWRTLYAGSDRCTAWGRYDMAVVRLRQGAVRLYDPDGLIVAGANAPRLRTR